MSEIGTLFVVATPIGNLQDITLRALDCLKSVDFIAAEDTRHSGKLLQHYGIDTPLQAFHDHNEAIKTDKIIYALQNGKKIALMSDAGTPLISDPGYHLVQKAREQNIPVVPIPGCCALIAALSASGLPTDRFVFEGFLPAKISARRQRLQTLVSETRTLIFYEAPHRLMDFLEDALLFFESSRQAVLAKEITKRYETILSGKLLEIVSCVKQNPDLQKGECVFLMEGANEKSLASSKFQEHDRLLQVLLPEVSLKKAVFIVAEVTGAPKNILYERALQLQAKGSQK